MQEKRLIFHAATTERQEAAEAQTSERGEDGELKEALEKLAQIDRGGRVEVERGGRSAVGEANAMRSNPEISELSKKILEKGVHNVELAAGERKADPQSAEKAKSLNEAVKRLKKSVELQKGRISGNAAANAEFGRLVGLPNAEQLFRDVKITAKSETKGGVVTLAWKEFSKLAGFKKLGLEQKQALLEKMREQIGVNPSTADALLKKFEQNSKLPQKWRVYAKNPEKWGHTREHAAKWLSENADKKILHSEQVFKYLNDRAHLLEKAGVKMPSREELFDKSTSEFNRYFDGVKGKIAAHDENEAKRMESLKVSEGAEIGTTSAEMKNSAAEKERAFDAKIGEWATKIKESPLRKRIEDRKKEAQREAKKDPASQAAEQIKERQSGKAFSFEKFKLGRIFGRGKDKAREESEEDVWTEEDVAEDGRLTKEVATDMTGREEELSSQDRKDLAEIFKPTQTLEKDEQARLLQLVGIHTKDLTREGLKREIKKDPALFRNKTELGKLF